MEHNITEAYNYWISVRGGMHLYYPRHYDEHRKGVYERLFSDYTSEQACEVGETLLTSVRENRPIPIIYGLSTDVCRKLQMLAEDIHQFHLRYEKFASCWTTKSKPYDYHKFSKIEYAILMDRYREKRFCEKHSF